MTEWRLILRHSRTFQRICSKQTLFACDGERSWLTCVVEHSGPLAWRAGGASYLSYHPDVDLFVLNELLFGNLIPSLVCAANRPPRGAGWLGTTAGETESTSCDEPGIGWTVFCSVWFGPWTSLAKFWSQRLKHSLIVKVIFCTAVGCIQVAIRLPFTAVNGVISFPSETAGTRRRLACQPFWKKKQHPKPQQFFTCCRLDNNKPTAVLVFLFFFNQSHFQTFILIYLLI